jgi:hypothetical protein
MFENTTRRRLNLKSARASRLVFIVFSAWLSGCESEENKTLRQACDSGAEEINTILADSIFSLEACYEEVKRGQDNCNTFTRRSEGADALSEIMDCASEALQEGSYCDAESKASIEEANQRLETLKELGCE